MAKLVLNLLKVNNKAQKRDSINEVDTFLYWPLLLFLNKLYSLLRMAMFYLLRKFQRSLSNYLQKQSPRAVFRKACSGEFF